MRDVLLLRSGDERGLTIVHAELAGVGGHSSTVATDTIGHHLVPTGARPVALH